jgi:hypothetical protein
MRLNCSLLANFSAYPHWIPRSAKGAPPTERELDEAFGVLPETEARDFAYCERLDMHLTNPDLLVKLDRWLALARCSTAAMTT